MINKAIFQKVLPITAAALVAVAGCAKKSEPVDSEVAWLASSSLSSAEVNKALRSRIAFRVNLKTNRATLYKNGVAVDQWNIASADVSGAYHNGETQFTPTGIYAVDDLQMCPAWYPRKPINPATGREVRSEAERAAVFANNPSIYGPCGARNPLGRYVLWFHGAYGLHGNSNESILELPTANERRVSGGCIRNPNSKIKEVFSGILNTFGELSSFRGSVASMEARPMNQRWTLTKSVASLNMRVVVGNWPNDPALNSTVDGPAAPVVTPKPEVTKQPERAPAPVATATPTVPPVPESVPALKPNKQSCYIGSVDQESNIAPVYSSVPSPTATVSSFYRNGWPVTVWAEVEGTNFVKVNRGYLDKKYLTRCAPVPEL
ncbi:MAG: hypothetical protein FJY29_12825 [Betaproteobacteria bacterium]|nr:hypothetical protein [Betaproteobacteria bacterium]